MIDIIKKRVIDWDLQLRKERNFNEKFGTNFTLSQVKELTGSFRRLTEKSKHKIGTKVLEQCEEFYLSLDKLKKNQYTNLCKNRSAAFFRIGKEPKKNPTTIIDHKKFKELDNELEKFKKDNDWDNFNP